VWEAVDYYKKAITLTDPRDSNLLAVLYEHLGRSLLRLPNDDVALKEEIITAFSTALEHDPSNDIARHLLSSQHQQGGEENPPESFIRRLFDDYAHNFEQSLASLNYSAPRLISEYLSQYTSMSWGCVIDLGCGSGLMAELLKNHTQGIVGIDLSPKMLFVAEEKNLYNMLIVGDMVGLVDELIAYRNDTGPSRSVGENRGVRRKMSGSKVLELDMVRQDNGFAWDEIIVGQKSLLVVAADVLVYVGSLDQLFTSVGRLLRPGDHFAFTVEALHVEGEFSWLLQSSGRFAHRQEYLEHLSKQHGFGILALDAVTPRKEKGEDVRGYVVLLEKN
jgi:predicted TPR repeat methyltransferase